MSKNSLWVKKGIRLKTIMKEQGYNLTDFSHNVLGLKYCTVSQIMSGRKNLTDKNASKVIEKFPQYRFEWLTAQDDVKKVGDLSYSGIKQVISSIDYNKRLFMMIALFCTNGDFEIIEVKNGMILKSRLLEKEVHLTEKDWKRVAMHINSVADSIIENEVLHEKG